MRAQIADYYEWARRTYKDPEATEYDTEETGGVWALTVAPPISMAIFQQYMEDTFLHCVEEVEDKERPSDKEVLSLTPDPETC